MNSGSVESPKWQHFHNVLIFIAFWRGLLDFKLELAMIGPNFKKRSALARFTFCLFNQNIGVFMMDKQSGWWVV